MSRRSSVRWMRWGAVALMIVLLMWLVVTPSVVEETTPAPSTAVSFTTSPAHLPSSGTVRSTSPIRWNATTEDGSTTGWQFGMVPMEASPRYARMLISNPSLSTRGACATYTSGKAPLKHLLHPAAEHLIETTGPDYFEAFVNTAWPEVVAVSLTFRFDASSCVYESLEGVALPPTGPPAPVEAPIGLTTFMYVTHVHARYDGINELVEGAHYPYVRSAASRRILPRLAAIVSGPSYIPLRYDGVQEVYRVGDGYQATPQPPQPPIIGVGEAVPPYWVASRPDPHYCRHHIDGAFKGYYLAYKGFRGAVCKSWGPRGHASLGSMDLLGRLDYGAAYHYAPHMMGSVRRRLVAAAGDDATLRRKLPSGCSNLISTPTAPSSDPVVLSKECIISLVGGSSKGAHTIYFVGDSHMRLFFYGFLSRMGITYPHDKVWRGDRSDTITGAGGTTMKVQFVASYFLNLTKDSAASMLAESAGDSTSTVVAGVGQHHTSNCWSLAKDRAVVEEALALLHGRPIVWFGIPAQPFNAHLSVPKPVGQSRKDCRNNQRHEFINAMQKELVGATNIPYIDTMSMTRGMAHTSLDGAHFYTWPRAAWIDELVLLLLERYLSEK